MISKVKIKVIRLAMLGNTRVGKTSICRVFFSDYFREDEFVTIGHYKYEKQIRMEDGNDLKLIIWDTSGQERFHYMSRIM